MLATARLRSRRMSTSGSSRRSSTRTQTSASTTPVPIRPSVSGAVQPQSLASVTPSSTHTRAPESSAAPSQSIRAWRTVGDSGTRKCAAAAAGRAISPSQKITEVSRLSTTTPASGRPMPPPMPNTALRRPMAPGTRSRGKVSRMIPKESGKTPPATPLITRPTIITSIESARAQTVEPNAKTSSTIVRTRPLPNRSPSLPTIGVDTDAHSR